ncbi:urease accessory UreF family protein [Streptomyces sp. NPDC048290]|uniref:urease accessory protein UreF n=1 Tax=Streptomyces sp. NPDC048290 TaxID=3155811 RepID=UPI00342D2E7F
MSRSTLLLLADGRFPAGGHAHSGGAEAAVRAGRVYDAASLEEFCRGRLHTVGLVGAALAAAAALGGDPVALDGAADARTPSPALRGASRRLGRQLLRAARAVWPRGEELYGALAREFPKGAHQAVVLGVVARGAGLGAGDAAHCAAYDAVSGVASATVRLLSLDPFEASGVVARLAGEVDRVAERGVEAGGAVVVSGEGVDALPAGGSPLLEIGGEAHTVSGGRLFAS